MRQKRFTLLNPTKSVRSNLTGLKLSAVLLLSIGLTGLQAQTSLNATGGDASGSGGSAAYTVGQVVYTTNTGTSGSVAEGVQQAYEISAVTAIEESQSISLSISAYPNPAIDYLTLELKEVDLSNLQFQLYDFTGKLLQTEKITSNQTSIDMGSLKSATYFIKVTRENNEVKTFKIIKN